MGDQEWYNWERPKNPEEMREMLTAFQVLMSPEAFEKERPGWEESRSDVEKKVLQGLRKGPVLILDALERGRPFEECLEGVDHLRDAFACYYAHLLEKRDEAAENN